MEEKIRHYPSTVNDEALSEHAKKVDEVLVQEHNVHLLPMFMAAEDFSFFGTNNETFGSSVKGLHAPYLICN